MNILIVDDQKAVVEGLRLGVDWQSIGMDNVYTACSAREARLILPNFDIDILLSDIEMPEEDGLSLLRWTKANYPEIVGIFLTSHADFDYARDALKIGCFDYILQPARNEAVQEVVVRAMEVARRNAKTRRLERIGQAMMKQKDGILELLALRAKAQNWEECRHLFQQLKEAMESSIPDCGIWSVVVQISRYGSRSDSWNENLIRVIFGNVITELFEKFKVKVCAAQERPDEYLILVRPAERIITETDWKKGMEEFYTFVSEKMEFTMAVYPEKTPIEQFEEERFLLLENRKASNILRKPGVYWEDVVTEQDLDINIERVKEAENYIRSNLGRGVSRSEVAEHLHLNEEYFSRLFKKYTGYTFKDYEMRVRIDQARKLLEHSHISVSIIASKVGYDNFSHFSRAFKKETGMSPQEYRKEKAGK